MGKSPFSLTFDIDQALKAWDNHPLTFDNDQALKSWNNHLCKCSSKGSELDVPLTTMDAPLVQLPRF